jgi:predicted kinase
MPESPSSRSVKIGADERTGWSSERPRRDGAPPRPANIAVRSRVLRPSDRMRYSPGSLLLVVGATASEPDRFLERVLEERGIALSVAKVRTLLAGRVADHEIEARACELLDATVAKRLQGGQSVVIAIDGFDAQERERYVRMAHGLRRPRHLLLIETARDRVQEDERQALDELRRALDAGELGQEGFQTAMRLGGNALSELKRIVFRPPPRED